MGGNTSKSTSSIDIVTNALTNVLMQNTNTADTNTINQQFITIGNIKNKGCTLDFDINQSMDISNTINILQSSGNSGELAQQFTAELNNQATAELSGVSFGNRSTAEAITDFTNNITNNINLENISSCISNLTNLQNIKMGNLEFDCTYPGASKEINSMNITQSLVMVQVKKCIQSNSNINKICQEFDATVSSSSTSVLKGFELNFGTGMVLVLIMGFLAFFMYKLTDPKFLLVLVVIGLFILLTIVFYKKYIKGINNDESEDENTETLDNPKKNN